MKILFLWEKFGKKPANNEDKNEFAAFPVVSFSTYERSEKLGGGGQFERKGKINPSQIRIGLMFLPNIGDANSPPAPLFHRPWD